jgi:DNA repair protein SbcD/Mre11
VGEKNMSIKIIHTADNHIGLKFSNYRKEVRDKLIEERFEALKNVVSAGNEKKCSFLVVAGDLFDSVSVKHADIKTTVSILKDFKGQAVLVLPGNHDYFTSLQQEPWKKFTELAMGTHIELLFDFHVRSYEENGEKISFYPCPCPGKYGEESLTPWVKQLEKEKDSLHVGIAHGNVEGMGLDTEGKYFNMTEAELKGCGADFWLLGHIHVPYPAPSFKGNPVYFMPATHTPDSIKRNHPGYAWVIEAQKGKELKFEQLTCGNIRFKRIERIVNNEADIDSLFSELNFSDAERTILDLIVSGRLTDEEIQRLAEWHGKVKDKFLDFPAIDTDLLEKRIDKTYIDRTYPRETLPYRLLTELSDDNEALQLANELIAALQKKK